MPVHVKQAIVDKIQGKILRVESDCHHGYLQLHICNIHYADCKAAGGRRLKDGALCRLEDCAPCKLEDWVPCRLDQGLDTLQGGGLGALQAGGLLPVMCLFLQSVMCLFPQSVMCLLPQSVMSLFSKLCIIYNVVIMRDILYDVI